MPKLTRRASPRLPKIESTVTFPGGEPGPESLAGLVPE
jgi:hypothetical protein